MVGKGFRTDCFKDFDDGITATAKIREFSKEEADSVIKSILQEKSKGLSVRRAIFNLANGDDKLMLRLQNKYRNTLKKQPERIVLLAQSMGLTEEAERARAYVSGKNEKTERKPEQEFLRRRLENEINALYDRLAQALKTENERLRAENDKLKERLQNA